MDMLTRLPEMADDALANLRANAVRLADAGTAKQKKAASDLLPAIQDEIAARQAKKAATAPAKTRRKAVAK